MYKKILVPLDGSEMSEAALAHAAMLAKCADAEVVLLRVVNEPVYLSLYPDTPPVTYNVKERMGLYKQAEGYLQRVAFDKFPATVAVSYEVTGGLPSDAILDYASGIHADIIVMSTHGRSGVSRIVMGSVADEVVHRAHVPVLLVRPPTN